MEGHKGSLFIFYLSFIGWYILASIGLSAMNSVPFIGMYLSIAGNCVFSALINGYILSGDPTYITSHKNARSNISKIERDELLEELVTYYLNNNLKG